MLPMSVAFEVSHRDTSRDVSDEQPENMEYMYVAFEVSHRDTSREVSDEQPENMQAVLVIPEQSSPVKSTSVKLLQE